jgi:hypothetical protein
VDRRGGVLVQLGVELELMLEIENFIVLDL